MLHAVGLPGSGNAFVSAGSASGMSRQPSSGLPMSTDTRCAASRAQVSKPRRVLSTTDEVPASRISMSATPRVALPQVSRAVPFAFQNCTRAVASSQSSTTAS